MSVYEVAALWRQGERAEGRKRLPSEFQHPCRYVSHAAKRNTATVRVRFSDWR